MEKRKLGDSNLPIALADRACIQVLLLALVITGLSSCVAGQEVAGQTVIQKATEQFENSPLKTTSLGNGVFVFSGDGGNVTAIVDDGSTLLIDSGIDSRTTELSDAIFAATHRPVTRLVNTHWHFDHTGGNSFFGSSGVKIIAQENVKTQLSSIQDVPFVEFRDGHYPAQALPAVTYSSRMTLRQGSKSLSKSGGSVRLLEFAREMTRNGLRRDAFPSAACIRTPKSDRSASRWRLRPSRDAR